jgi:Domain of unknown function (DU1801)
MKKQPTSDTAAAQLARFIAKFTPEIARALAACRRKVRALVPGGYELVYDNYNALGIGYGPGQRASDVVISVVAYPRWVTLFFLDGRNLSDPKSLLSGTGSRVRSIRLQSPKDLDAPYIRSLISQALAPHRRTMTQYPGISTLIKSVAARQRPRRPAGRIATNMR